MALFSFAGYGPSGNPGNSYLGPGLFRGYVHVGRFDLIRSLNNWIYDSLSKSQNAWGPKSREAQEQCLGLRIAQLSWVEKSA